jgi:hypothetical protein
MKIMIEMPTIDTCEATGCAYNADRKCHARAITVGGGTHPACDTFIPADQHVDRDEPAGVGACKVTTCRHNQNLECEASAIVVAPHAHHADCMTFDER